MDETRRESKGVRLNVKVPQRLLEALDEHAKRLSGGPVRATRADAVRELLSGALRREASHANLRVLRFLVQKAVAAAAGDARTTTLASVREALPFVSRSELDRALLALEADGALELRTSSGEVDARQRGAALVVPGRGELVIVVVMPLAPRQSPPRVGHRNGHAVEIVGELDDAAEARPSGD